MALRRVLPSRVNAEPPNGGSVAAAVSPVSSVSAPASELVSPPAPSLPVNAPAAPAASTAAAAIALLDEPVLSPLDVPAPAAEAPQEAPRAEAKSFRAPTPVVVDAPPALPQAPVILPSEPFVSAIPAVGNAAIPEPVAASNEAPSDEAPSVFGDVAADIPAAPLQPLPEPEAAASAEPAALLEPSLPGETGGSLRRKMQPRKPRSFDLPAAPEAASAAATSPAAPVADNKPVEPAETAPASVNERGVPINTTPLDLVDDKLAEAGVIAPETDPLTSRAPTALAETEAPFGAMDDPLPPLPSLDIPPFLDAPLSAEAPAGLSASLLPATPSLPSPFSAPAALPISPATDLTSVPEAPASARRAPAVAPDFSLASKPESKPLPSAPLADLPPMASDLPWSNTPAGDGWDFAQSTLEEPSSPMPYAPDNGPADIFKNVPSNTIAGLPFSSSPAGASSLPPPEITGQHPRSSHGGNGGGSLYMILGAGAVAAVIIGAYWLVSHNGAADATQWAQNLASKPAAVSASTTGPVSNSLGLSGTALMPPPAIAEVPGQPISSSAQIAFADVPPEQASQPIVADGTEKMPQDISLVAKLQQAVADRKAQEQTGVSPTLTTETGTKAADSTQLKAQLDKELAAYRKALAEASGVSNVPPPGKFLGSASGATGVSAKTDAEGAPLAAASPTPMGLPADTPASADTSGTALLPPPSAASLPPASLYANNPNNLPVVAEPTASEPAKVRTLEDFNVAMFEPKEDKVRIPKGVKPKISTSDFPQMELLSLVPGKGIIAYYQGREGVLLLGESLDGWELSMVKADVAEFKNGDKTHFISSNE